MSQLFDGGGWLLIAPQHAPALARLVRAGALTFAGRRRLTKAEADVLMLVEQAAYAAGSAAGTTAVTSAPALPSSTVTVDQAATVLGVSGGYVRRLCRSGTLTATRHGASWLVDVDSVTELALLRKAA